MQKEQYIQKLINRGYEQLGKGLYSTVLAIPNSNRVIKVGEMDQWPAYILWATQHGFAGKFAPKVYSLKFHDDYYVAIMERLVCTINQTIMPIDDDGRPLPSARSIQAEIFDGLWRDDIEGPFADYIAELKGNRFTGDLHGGNFMLRHDGQLVVTDPVCGGYSGSTSARIKRGACL